MAWATVRTLAKVNSSAMIARQPSVPNMSLLTEEKYKRWGWRREAGSRGDERQIGGWGAGRWKRPGRGIRNLVTAYVVAKATSHKGRSLHGWRAGVAARSNALEEGIAFLLFEPFYDFGYVLGAGAGAEEQSVVGFDQDHIVDA